MKTPEPEDKKPVVHFLYRCRLCGSVFNGLAVFPDPQPPSFDNPEQWADSWGRMALGRAFLPDVRVIPPPIEIHTHPAENGAIPNGAGVADLVGFKTATVMNPNPANW